MTDQTRRGLLRRGAVALAGTTVLAGCTDTDATDEANETATATTADTDPEPVSTARTETTSPTPRTTPVDGLDLREANVTGVTVEDATDTDGRDATDYRLAVTLHHDDDGEAGYANWWQVETRSGRRLGRRDLAHSHGTRAFTRSATVTVPNVVETAVVRGHDQTHGYGGQAALVTLTDERVDLREQGPEPDDFALGTSRGTAARVWP